MNMRMVYASVFWKHAKMCELACRSVCGYMCMLGACFLAGVIKYCEPSRQ